MTIKNCFKNYRQLLNSALDSIKDFDLDLLTTAIIDAYERKVPILICGNGGSASISEHFSCDHTKGVRLDTGIASNIIPLTTNFSLISAIANDLSYDDIFSKQIEWFQSEAILLVITSSGNSPNIIKALKAAKKKGMYTMALVGFEGGKIVKDNMADVIVHVKSDNYGVVEDAHQIIMHGISQHIRKKNHNGNKPLKL